MITVDDEPREWRPGLTVAALLDEDPPDFPMYVVKVDGSMVMRSQYDSFEIEDGAEVRIVYMIAGG